jgi:hypothetical protein
MSIYLKQVNKKKQRRVYVKREILAKGTSK